MLMERMARRLGREMYVLSEIKRVQYGKERRRQLKKWAMINIGILKSPVMINSDAEGTKLSSSVANSELKVDRDDDGGRYITRTVKYAEDIVSRTQSDSKDEKEGMETVTILR